MTLREGATAAELTAATLEPSSHPRTADPLDPLTNPLGFDGGMLRPGQAYRRSFPTSGEYAYTDGAGHSGTIVVEAPPPPPTVASVYPSKGAPTGGVPVTLSGMNFEIGTTVTFGGTAAAKTTVVSATSIVAVIPPHVAGTVDIVVTNPDAQSATLASGFAYVAGYPDVQRRADPRRCDAREGRASR